MKTKIITFIISSAIFMFPGLALATDYYVDYDDGDDSSSGTSVSSPWKHAPGDSNASSNPASVTLVPGDNVIFRGGVIYRGTIDISFSGQDGSPISYYGDRWGSERAVIDGGAILNGWQRCSSAEDCGGNSNWANIFYTYIPEEINAFIANLHELNSSTGEEDFLYVAQDPNPMDPYFFDDRRDFMPVSNSDISRTSITDPSFFYQSDSTYWDNSYVQVWVNPNAVVIRSIDNFDPSSDTISFEDLGTYAIYPDGRDQSYAIYNSIHALDYAGEFSINKDVETGLGKKVFLWPRNSVNLDTRITYSERRYGFDIQGSDHITLEGFEIRKHSGEYIREGGAITTNSYSSSLNEGLKIVDNYLSHNRHATRGYGSIFLNNISDSLIENNLVEDNPKNRGIFITASDNVVIKGNTILRPGGTALGMFTGRDTQILNNTIKDSRGSHANGITLYMGSYNILVAGNKIFDSLSPLTFQDSGNLWFINNLIDGNNEGSNVNEWSDTSHGPWERGTIAFLGNTILRSNNNNALNIGGKGGMVFEDDFSGVLGTQAERLALLRDLYSRGYIEDGVVKDSFRNLVSVNSFNLSSQFSSNKQEIYGILKEAGVKNDYVAVNNIIDGGGRIAFEIYDEDAQVFKTIMHPNMISDYNIYTGLSWQQRSRYGWSLAEHEFEALDTNVCEDPLSDDFHIFLGSEAVDVGTDIAPYLSDVYSIFPSYDYHQDIAGTSRPSGPKFDIGAYEFNSANNNRFDVDGRNGINTSDALLVLRSQLGLNMSETEWKNTSITGDVDCNSTVNSADALLLLRHSLGLDMGGTQWCG